MRTERTARLIGGGGAAHIVPPILSATAVALDGCYFTSAHVQGIPGCIKSAKEYLALIRKRDKDLQAVVFLSRQVSGELMRAFKGGGLLAQKAAQKLARNN